MPPVPAYRDLPSAEHVRHSWGVWGKDDRLGTLNHITREAVRRGLRAAHQGKAFSLNLPMHLPDPPLFGRPRFTHELVEGTNASLNDVISAWNPQNSSQWDGFRHVVWHQHGNYNGVPSQRHGVHLWAQRPIVTRAILADVGRWRESERRPVGFTTPELVEAAEIKAGLRTAGVTVEPGDILLIRTGWLEWYLTQDENTRERLARRGGLVSPGLAAREEMAELLWDMKIAAVAADNPVLEAWPQGAHLSPERFAAASQDPGRRHEVSLHARLLPALGMPIGELWDLAALATDCADDGQYTMCLTSAPANLAGGAATPANAIAIK
jgi:kynurenine formamidase